MWSRGWSLRDLVGWLTSDERVPPAPSGKPWATHSIKVLLHNPIYAGWVRYNHRPVGYYQRAAPDAEHTVAGTLEGLPHGSHLGLVVLSQLLVRRECRFHVGRSQA